MVTLTTQRMWDFDFAAYQRIERQCQRCIGLVPQPMLEKYIGGGRLRTLREGTEVLGYLIAAHATRRRSRYPLESRVFVAAIEYSSRDHRLGALLVEDAVRRSMSAGNRSVGLWCAEDIEANEFWKAMGFVAVGERAALGVRRRCHIEYELVHSPGAGLFGKRRS